MNDVIEAPEAHIRIADLIFTLRLHPESDKIMTPVLLKTGIWEPTETRVFLALLQDARTVLDIGANIGWYATLAGLKLRGRGQVVAFEPAPQVFALLAENVARNGLHDNVTVINGAVADRRGDARFAITPDHVGDHHLVVGDEAGAISIPVTTVDAVRAELGRDIDLIKIDTQGAELCIFRGMMSTLAEQERKPILISEFWPLGLNRMESSALELLSEWQKAGYLAYRIDSKADCLRPVSFSRLSARVTTDLAPDGSRFIDLVLIPRGDPRAELIVPFVKPYPIHIDAWVRVRQILGTWKRRFHRRFLAKT